MDCSQKRQIDERAGDEGFDDCDAESLGNERGGYRKTYLVAGNS